MISDEPTLKISRKWAKNIVLRKIKLGSKYNDLREEYKKRFKDTSSGVS